LIDKGYTKQAYVKMRSIMPEAFSAPDLGPHANSGMILRGLRYGIIVKVGHARYKVADGVRDPWAAYQEVAERTRRRGNPKKGKALPVAVNGDRPIHTLPPISSMSFNENQELLRIGKRLYLAVEVGLVPKGGKI
jgi:hypothetical protein